ncbi:hypothetical protein M8494_07100 [Serratia ureilytica]
MIETFRRSAHRRRRRRCSKVALAVGRLSNQKSFGNRSRQRGGAGAELAALKLATAGTRRAAAAGEDAGLARQVKSAAGHRRRGRLYIEPACI